MRPIPRVLLVLALVLGGAVLSARGVQAQETEVADTVAVRVTLTDGSVLNGVIIAETGDTVTIRTAAGATVTVTRSQVRAIQPLEGRLVGGLYRRADPNRTRLLFAPTGRPLPRGRGYFADYYLVLPFVAYGATDRLTLAGGISIVPGLDLTDQLVYAAPKLTVYRAERVDAAVGTFLATSPGESEYGGLVYAIGTFGSSERAFTGGLGFAFGSGGFENSPALLLGGELQVSGSIKFITENYVFVSAGETLLSGGVRFFGDRLAADLGLVTLSSILDGDDGIPFVPLLSFTYNFGR